MPTRAPTPPAPIDEPLADEAGLDPVLLASLDLPPLTPETVAPALPVQPSPATLRALAELRAALSGDGAPLHGEQLLEEATPLGTPTPHQAWWTDPALRAHGDEDPLPEPASPPAKPRS